MKQTFVGEAATLSVPATSMLVASISLEVHMNGYQTLRVARWLSDQARLLRGAVRWVCRQMSTRIPLLRREPRSAPQRSPQCSAGYDLAVVLVKQIVGAYRRFGFPQISQPAVVRLATSGMMSGKTPGERVPITPELALRVPSANEAARQKACSALIVRGSSDNHSVFAA